MPRMRAVIDWIPKDQGGRSQPPAGIGPSTYSPLVRFTDSEDSWPPPAAWSLAVEKVPGSSLPSRWTADIHYLVDESPHESLRPGREFELYEGGKLVAHGKILDIPQPREREMPISSLPRDTLTVRDEDVAMLNRSFERRINELEKDKEKRTAALDDTGKSRSDASTAQAETP